MRRGVPNGARMEPALGAYGGLAGGHTLAQATAWCDGKDSMERMGCMGMVRLCRRSGCVGNYFMSYFYALFIYGLFIDSFDESLREEDSPLSLQ